jgi:hypothetical protein
MVGYWPLLLLDDQLSDVQPSDLKLLYVQTLDPATLHGERPDRQSTNRHCSRRARTNRQSAEARPPQSCSHPCEPDLRPERALLPLAPLPLAPLPLAPLRLPCSAHLVHRPLLSERLGGIPRATPFHHKHDAMIRTPV